MLAQRAKQLCVSWLLFIQQSSCQTSLLLFKHVEETTRKSEISALMRFNAAHRTHLPDHLPDFFRFLEDFLHIVLVVAAAEILTALKAEFTNATVSCWGGGGGVHMTLNPLPPLTHTHSFVTPVLRLWSNKQSFVLHRLEEKKKIQGALFIIWSRT